MNGYFVSNIVSISMMIILLKQGIDLFGENLNGALQPARGQARIPKMSDLLYLVSKAMEQGWGNLEEKEVDLKENVISQIEED